MGKRKSGVTNRAWNILRMALLWARKGGVLKTRLVMDLRLHLKNLRHSSGRTALRYGERQLSFDDTPIFHVKMHRPSSMRFRLPHIPCINPDVDFDYDFQDDDRHSAGCEHRARQSFLMNGDEDEVCEEDLMVSCGDEGIDRKADEFIAKFYQQMKLQRQISYLQSNEMMLNRSST